MNKASGAKGLYRGLGSIDIMAAARSVLLVGRSKSDPTIRVMVQLKNSLAREGKPIAFEIHEDASLRWIGEYDTTAEELLLGHGTPEEGPKISEAMEYLADILRGGEVACTQIYEQLREMGISKRTVDSAKKKLNVKSIRHAGSWYWSLATRSDWVQ